MGVFDKDVFHDHVMVVQIKGKVQRETVDDEGKERKAQGSQHFFVLFGHKCNYIIFATPPNPLFSKEGAQIYFSCGSRDLIYDSDMQVSVVIPAFNEECGLKTLIPEIFSVLGPDCEVLVVNDCSTDNSASVARELGATVLDNPYNI